MFRLPTIDVSLNASELTARIESVLNDHGSVLIPCTSTGLIFDMFEFLTKYFEQINHQVQMYFISPVSNANLAISNAMSEWVTEQRQTAAFSGTSPFKHHELVKSKLLITIPSDRLDDTETLINFEQPSIIFTGHISLRFGPIVQLMEKFKSSSSNAIIFVENSYSYLDALKPYQPIHMKCFYLPIDTRLNFSQAKILMNEKIRPRCLILPEEYQKDIGEGKRSTISYRQYDNLKLPSLARPFIPGQLNITQCVRPKLISPSAHLAIASVHGHLDMHDYVYDINEISDEDKRKSTVITYGRVDTDKFLMNLSKNGLFGLEVHSIDDRDSCSDDDDNDDTEKINRSLEIIYNNGLANICVRSKQTDIRCNDPILTNKIRDALLSDNIGTL